MRLRSPIRARPLALAAAVLSLASGLLAASPARAQAPGGPQIKFDIDGYYRMRAFLFGNLYDKEFPKNGPSALTLWYMENPVDIPADFTQRYLQTHREPSDNELVQAYCGSYPTAPLCRRAVRNPHRSGWITQRGRFEPILTMGGIKLQATIDVFDNVVWGDNENLAATPLFAGEPSATQPDGDFVDTIQAKRLWIEWTTAFGLLRIGRQPSQWGMGLLANDGNGFKNDFGDSDGGATYDRIIFATRPVTLVKGIAAIATGKPTPNPADDPGIVVAVGFDKLVESSAITFRKRITKDDNLSDENEPGDSNLRNYPIWLADQGDDVLEMVYVLMFRRENWHVGGELMDLTVGTYWVNRWQKETASNVWIPDLYVKWKLRGVFFEGELYTIFGKTQAIAPDFDKTTRAKIVGAVGRIGYENPYVTGLFELGHASGDDVILDERFTGRPLSPDYNVGLILYEQVLAQRTIEKFVGDENYRGLWSNGGVYNSTYLNPRFKYRPGDVWEFRLGFLAAWADKVDGNLIPYLSDAERDSREITEGKLLGVEVDAGIHMKWLEEHILIGVEGGYMHAGPRLGRMSQYADPREAAAPTPYNAAQYDAIKIRLNNVWTVQGRFAFVF
jgi:hypothetical protein